MARRRQRRAGRTREEDSRRRTSSRTHGCRDPLRAEPSGQQRTETARGQCEGNLRPHSLLWVQKGFRKQGRAVEELTHPKQTMRPKVAFELSASCFSSLLSARFCSNGISATMCSTRSPASRIFLASSSCPALSASSHFSRVMSSMSVKSLTLSKVPLVKSQQIQ